ncbi:hypothetical protein C8R43DRAFT_166136 [Mycena crocata]|nr:hypothetical protein C8R43DRAFT_166136 [Mycena crocata]
MSLRLALDVILGVTPVPGLSPAFSIFKLIVSSVEQATKSKRQLEVLAASVAQLLEALNTEFKAARILHSACTKPLKDLYTLLNDIQRFIQAEQERPFFKALFTSDSQISEIEDFYRRIDAVASAFQISALLNIQHMISNDERARRQDIIGLHARLNMMEQNQLQFINQQGGKRSNGSPFLNPSSYCTRCGTWAEYGTHSQCGGAQAQSTVVAASTTPAPWATVLIHPRKTDPYFGFTNCSPYPVKYNGKEYPTSDHLFHAFKYMDHRPDIAEEIRTTAKSPQKAVQLSLAYAAHQNPDWDRMCIAKMEIALWHKFNQNLSIKKQLLETGDAQIINHTQNGFWGVGKNLTGGNELGKVLERVRAGLRNSTSYAEPTVAATSTPQRSQKRNRILFHPRRKDKYYFLTNAFPHPVKYGGKEYPTSQHLFQALKYLDKRPDIAERIRTISKSPDEAVKYSLTQVAYQHPDWNRMNASKMEIAVWHKFTQHTELKQALLDTGDAELVNDTRNEIWGVGKDGKGRNELGKALERVRTALRKK